MKRTLDNLMVKWKALAPQRRILLAAVAATLVIGAYMVTSKVNQVQWAVLYANVDDVTASSVMASLDGKGIEYKLDGNGTRILVPVDSLDTTRIALANEGISGQAVPDGFNEIFDNQGLATTDFAQQVNYERALEGELARTLLSMDAIDGANVQLSIPEKSVFVGQQTSEQDKPTASVLVSLNRPLTQDEVDTVSNLISSSVPGLTVDQITVASTDGTLLKAPGSGDAAGAGSNILEQTQAYETSLSQRLTNLVRDITGSNSASVEVRAELDFTQKTTEQRTIDPTNNSPSAESKTTEAWDGTGVVPGGVAGVDGGPTDATSDSTGTYTKSEETTTWNKGDETVTSATSNTPTLKRLGIAVVIPPVPADASYTLADIQEAVSSAANLQETDRGDTIKVIESVAAAAAADPEAGLVTDPVAVAAAGVSPVLVIVAAALGAAFVLLFGVFGRKRKAKKAAVAAALAAMADPTLMNLAPIVAEVKGGKPKKRKRKKGEADDEPAQPVLVGPDLAGDKAAMDEIRGDLEKILAESPESLASLLSGWMTK